jgi:hypothetical protein
VHTNVDVDTIENAKNKSSDLQITSSSNDEIYLKADNVYANRLTLIISKLKTKVTTQTYRSPRNLEYIVIFLLKGGAQEHKNQDMTPMEY